LNNDSQKSFFAEIASELGIVAEGGNGVEVLHRGPYRLEIDHVKNQVAISLS
jgi:hypothetical protein